MVRVRRKYALEYVTGHSGIFLTQPTDLTGGTVKITPHPGMRPTTE